MTDKELAERLRECASVDSLARNSLEPGYWRDPELVIAFKERRTQIILEMCALLRSAADRLDAGLPPTDEGWRKANHTMPDVMRLIWTSPDANQFHPVMRQERLEDRWPQHPVVAVIGPFDNHTGQGKLQERLLAVVQQWNSECARKVLRDD